MGTRKTTEPSAYGLEVRLQILAELGKRGLNAYTLSKMIDRGNSYLNDRIKNADRELSLSDVEMICNALDIEIGPLMQRAEDEMLNNANMSYPQASYDLAAKKDPRTYTNQPGFEEGVEYYE